MVVLLQQEVGDQTFLVLQRGNHHKDHKDHTNHMEKDINEKDMANQKLLQSKDHTHIRIQVIGKVRHRVLLHNVKCQEASNRVDN